MIKKILLSTPLIFAFATLFINQGIKLSFIQVTNSITTEDVSCQLGYSQEDIMVLNNRFNPDEVNDIFIKQIQRNQLFPYLKYKVFILKNMELYEHYRLTHKVSYLESLNTINHPNLMKNFYEHSQESMNVDTNLVLVNKNYYLKNDYVPKELVYPDKLHLLIPTDTTRNLVKQETYHALIHLFEAAKRKGLFLYLSNGYRSYDRQDRIYNEYLIEGSHADDFSARAGHSEHQTGLAVDLTSKSVQFLLVEEFALTEEGRYLTKNAHKFGFIIRYPKDKEKLTGYKYEPWHLRYVGVEVAEIINKYDLTLEEYLLKYTEMPIKQ